MEDITKKILENMNTKSDFYSQTAVLKEFFEYAFFSKPKKETNKESFRNFLRTREGGISGDDKNALLAFDDYFFSQFNEKNFYDFFEEALTEVELLPAITIYFPVSFSRIELANLADWFKKNINPNIIMDVKVDSELVTGCAFIWKDVYHDFSFNRFLSGKKDEISKMVKASE